MATVFITGAGSGIGKELTKLFAEKGYDLILLSKTMKKLEEIKREVENRFPIECKLIECDLGNIENIYKTGINEIIGDSIPDILINCAGIGKISKVENLTVEEELQMINVNFVSPVILSKLFLKKFLKMEKGTIINICSMASLYPHPYMSAYSASKAGLFSYSLAIGEEIKKEKPEIRILSLCLGAVSTGFIPEDIRKKFGKIMRYEMSPEKAAKKIIRAYEENRKFAIIGTGNKILFKLLQLFPLTVRIKTIEKFLRRGL